MFSTSETFIKCIEIILDFFFQIEKVNTDSYFSVNGILEYCTFFQFDVELIQLFDLM